jgi:hypothetical protein
MISFLDYLQLREEDEVQGASPPSNDANQMQAVNPPSDMPMDKASGSGDKPVVPGDGNSERHLEKLKNSLNHFLNEKLLPAIKHGKVSKEDGMKLVQTEISAFSNLIGVDIASNDSTSKNAMATNSEPLSPVPNQPTANG